MDVALMVTNHPYINIKLELVSLSHEHSRACAPPAVFWVTLPPPPFLVEICLSPEIRGDILGCHKRR